MTKIRKKIVIHPIMSFLILIVVTGILSTLLSLMGFSANYNFINALRGTYDTTTVAVTSLFSLSGLKLIFRTAVSNFATFAPLVNLIIVLIGIGILDRSGFMQSFTTLVTQNANKYKVTLFLTIFLLFASITGDIAFIILIPLTALFFKYSKRNPKAGIILAFAALSCGTSINIFMNSIDSSLLEYTRLAALSLDATYRINTHGYLFIMILMAIIMAIIITNITEKVIVPKLEKYEEPEEEEFYLDKKKKKGIILTLSVVAVYLILFIYSIIPGLPLSGTLLDYSQSLYIDKLFGYNSFFNQGFVFIITFGLFLCGFFYGIGAKTIKSNSDMCNYLGHSLDGVGKTLVLIFFASLLINVFKDSGIGNVMAAQIANFIGSSSITGIPLILITFGLVAVLTIFVPSPVTSWSILSSSIVPVFMNAGMSAEFACLVFRAAQSVTYGLTPLMAYFVIYLAYLNNYSEDKSIIMYKSISYILPYAGATALIWITLLILSYILGVPIGISTTALL